MLATKFHTQAQHEKSSYQDTAADLVFTGIVQLDKIKEEMSDNSISSKAIFPKVGCQYGMYGELLFNPAGLLMTSPTATELEELLKNLGQESHTSSE